MHFRTGISDPALAAVTASIAANDNSNENSNHFMKQQLSETKNATKKNKQPTLTVSAIGCDGNR